MLAGVKRAVLVLVLAGCASAPPIAAPIASSEAPAAKPRGPSREAAVRLEVRGRELGPRPFAHDTIVTALAFSPDGERLATGSRDGSVRVFDLDGRELERRDGHAAAVTF